MATPIIMPKFGQMTEESTIVEWLKKEGDRIEKGDTVFSVETDKSVMEVESFNAGTLLKIIVPVGAAVPVQSVVGWLGEAGEAIPEAPAPAIAAPAPVPVAAAASPPAAPLASARPMPIATVPDPMPVAVATPVQAAIFRISPRAAALAKRSVIDPRGVRGTGPQGRVVEKDVRAHLKAHDYASLRVSPAAKVLAAREGIDLLAIPAGPDRRIAVADIERALAERPTPLSKMRQVIAQRLTQSVVTQPHFYVTVEVDMSEVQAQRARLAAAGAKYSVTDFVALASVLALKEFPAVNSSTDGRTVRWSSRVHLGLAVTLDEGLVVPVIRDADELTLAELSATTKALVDKARAGRLAPEEMSGSTFSISNMGMMDVENFTAIINTGEAAILAVSSTLNKPVARGDAVVIRPICKMTLSSDHRLVDGALAARFVNRIKSKLEDSGLWNSLT